MREDLARAGVVGDAQPGLVLDHRARSSTSSSRQRLVRDIGRHSWTRTVSPAWASLLSSWTCSVHRAAEDLVVALVPARDVHAHGDRLVAPCRTRRCPGAPSGGRGRARERAAPRPRRGRARLGALDLLLGAVGAALARVASRGAPRARRGAPPACADRSPAWRPWPRARRRCAPCGSPRLGGSRWASPRRRGASAVASVEVDLLHVLSCLFGFSHRSSRSGRRRAGARR